MADNTRATVSEVIIALTTATAKLKGTPLTTTTTVVNKPAKTDAFSQLMENSAVPSAEKVRKRLGWTTTRASIVDEAEVVAAAAATATTTTH